MAESVEFNQRSILYQIPRHIASVCGYFFMKITLDPALQPPYDLLFEPSCTAQMLFDIQSRLRLTQALAARCADCAQLLLPSVVCLFG